MIIIKLFMKGNKQFLYKSYYIIIFKNNNNNYGHISIRYNQTN